MDRFINRIMCFRDLSKDQKVELLKQIDETVNRAIDINNDFIHDSESSITKSWRKDIDQKTNPSIEYEMVRRRVEMNTQEFWNFVHSEVVKAQTLEKSDNSEVLKVLQNVLNLGVEHKRFDLLIHFKNTLRIYLI